MHIEGSCHCGEIKFRSEIIPEEVEICHCTDCQTLSGSAFHTIVPEKEGSFEITSGELKQYTKTADDGAKRVQSFCPECGSPICSSPPEGTPGVLRVRVGVIKQRDQLTPKCSTGFALPNPGLRIFRGWEKLKQNNYRDGAHKKRIQATTILTERDNRR